MIKCASLSVLFSLLVVNRSDAAGPARECHVEAVKAVPITADKSIYEAKGTAISVRFNSEVLGKLVSEFPEPPATIIALGNSCKIEDGGIWHADGVLLTTDGKRAFLEETSGAGTTWILYDAHTCKQLREVDDSAPHPVVNRHIVELQHPYQTPNHTTKIDLCGR